MNIFYHLLYSVIVRFVMLFHFLRDFNSSMAFYMNCLLCMIEPLIFKAPHFRRLKYKPIVSENTRLVILANGPSLTEDIARLKKQGNLENIDFLMMNFSATHDIFEELKPKFYTLADEMFYREDYHIDKVKNLFKNLNEKTSWDMTLLLAYDVKRFKCFSNLKNSYIKYQRVFINNCPFINAKRFKYYKEGVSMPRLYTVANMAVYAGIQYGYKQIELCGVDMSMLNGIYVNDDNITCTLQTHYYDKENTLMKPYINPNTNQPMELDKYIDMINFMVKSHRDLSEYAKHMGVVVINRTRRSMLDCYTRLIQIRPDLFNY